MTALADEANTSAAAWIAAAAQAWQGTQRSARYGLEETAKLGRAWTRRLTAAVPELLLNRALAGKKSDLANAWNIDNSSCPIHIEGILSCHALGAMGDTIDLLGDLGRATRIASALGKQKHFAIMLAGQEWSSYNRIAREYGIANFAEVEEWRLRLYTGLGCQVHVCSLEYEPGGRRKVKDLAKKYVEWARELFGRDNISRTLSKEDVAKLRSEAYPEALALLKVGIVADRVRGDWEVIENVIDNLNRLDDDTFTYYLTQRFQQYAFRDYLKVAMRSEKSFDLPFLQLDKGSPRRGIERALYFKEYVLRDDPQRPPFVIPYYFPSGNLYVGRQIPLQQYRAAVILLDTLDDYEHCMAVFNEMPYPSNARLLSDLLSFVHTLCFPLADGCVLRPGEKREDVRNAFRTDDASRFQSAVSDVDAEFGDAWRVYATQHGVFEPLILQWSDNLWAGNTRAMPLPYYFFPYWWLRPHGDGAEIARSVFKTICVLLASVLDAPTSPRDE